MRQFRSFNGNHRLQIGIAIALAGLCYAALALVDHYLFRTAAFDYGIRNNMLWHFAHFDVPDVTLKQPAYNNYLSNHFVIITALVSPLYWLLGSYALLIVQIASMLAGGYGVYFFFRRYSEQHWLALLAMVHFFGMWAMTSGLSFGYRENVVAAMGVPWLFYAFHYRVWKGVAVAFLLILLCKETVAFWLFFVMLGLVWHYRHSRQQWRIALLLAVLSLVYFFVVSKVVMPAIDQTGRGFVYFDYHTTLGSGLGEAVVTMLTEPLSVMRALFLSHLEPSRYQGIKGEFYLVMVLSGGIFTFIRPTYLPMVLPLIAIKMLNDDVQKWGINYHYSIEFAPLITFALFGYLSGLSSVKKQRWLAGGLLLLSLGVHVWKLENRRSVWYKPDRAQFYRKAHYQRYFDVDAVHRALRRQIPGHAKVSAHTKLAPHLAFRDTAYVFPTIKNARYIALLKSGVTYPLERQAYHHKLDSLQATPYWKTIHERSDLLLLKRQAIE